MAIGSCLKPGLLTSKNNPIFYENTEPVWIKIGNEEPDIEFQNIFVGKKIGDTLSTRDSEVQHYFCETSYADYTL